MVGSDADIPTAPGLELGLGGLEPEEVENDEQEDEDEETDLRPTSSRLVINREDAKQFFQRLREKELKIRVTSGRSGRGTDDGRPNTAASSSQAQLPNAFYHDYAALDLHPDAADRPMWVVPNGSIILETFSSKYRQAYDFLIAIAEPSSRPELINEYVLTPASLYAAVSVGLQTDEIIHYLEQFSKTHLPQEIREYVQIHTKTYGKVMLILRENRYFIDTYRPECLQHLLRDEVIQGARVHRSLPSSSLTAT